MGGVGEDKHELEKNAKMLEKKILLPTGLSHQSINALGRHMMENVKKDMERLYGDALQEAFENESGPKMGLVVNSETLPFQSQLAPPASLSALHRLKRSALAGPIGDGYAKCLQNAQTRPGKALSGTP